jgi:hypothetical protein
MSIFKKTTLVDEYGNEVEATMLNQLKVAESNRLAGGVFNVVTNGDAPDTNFWTVANTAGGTTVVTNSEGILTLTTSSGSATQLQSKGLARYMGANSNYYRSVLRLSVGAVNNVRRWGASTGNSPTDGMMFELSDTTFSIVTRKAGTDTKVSSGSFNGDGTKTSQSYSLDTNYHTFEIYYTNKKVMFVIDGTPIHTVTATTTPYIGTHHLRPTASNINTGVGSACTMGILVATISRLGVIASQSKVLNLTTGNTLLKIGPGFLHQVDINSLDSKIITVYDGTTAGGTLIGTVDTTKASIGPMLTSIPFEVGLYITLSGATNITVVYE